MTTSENILLGPQEVLDLQNRLPRDRHAPDFRPAMDKMVRAYNLLSKIEQEEFGRLRLEKYFRDNPIQPQEPEMGGGADGIVDYLR